MHKGTTLLVILFLVLPLALALGAILAAQAGPSAAYQSELEALHLETAAKMQAIKVGFWGGLAVVVLFGTAGIMAGLVRATWQRSRLIHPHANGLFPVVQGRIGGQTYYHDPHRSLASAVVYGAGPGGVEMQQLLPAGAEAEQLQVTTQAQATQLVAAAGQGGGMTAPTRRLVEGMTKPPRLAPRMPEVVVPDETIPEERRLLAAIRAGVEEVEEGE